MRQEETLVAVRAIADRVAGEMGLEIVEIVLRGSTRQRVLRIDVDRAGPRGVDLEDCARLSRCVSDEIDAIELVPGAYTLEVSSPGLDRPIRSPDDARRNSGRRVRLDLSEAFAGRRHIRGLLKGWSEAGWVVEADDAGDVVIPFTIVRSARQDAGF